MTFILSPMYNYYMSKSLEFKESMAANGIFYRLYGEDNPGPPLAMIMGYRGCMFAWPLDFVARLAEHYKVLIFDNRGTGRSTPLEEDKDLSMYDFASDLKELLSCLGYQSANIFGYSMGGSAALEFAHYFPEQTERVVLQSTTGGGSLFTGADPEVKGRLANPRGSTIEEMLFDFFDLCMSAEAVDRHRDVLNNICTNTLPYLTPPATMEKQLKASRCFDASGYARALNKKTLLIHGLCDRILKPANGQLLAEALPDCRAVFLETCGHCPHIEYEDIVFAELRDFLNHTD